MRNLKFIFIFIFLFGCNTAKDKKMLLGKWHSDELWFEFVNDSIYNGGVASFTEIKAQAYLLDEKQKSLSLFTPDKNKVYYLKYKFIGRDSIEFINQMNSSGKGVIYYKK